MSQLAARPGASPALAKWEDLRLVIPADMPYDEWYKLLCGLGQVVRASGWWIGDALVHGERSYLEEYAQAVDELGLDKQTLQNYAFTCRHVPPERRRKELSFSHHSAVASLEAGLQEAYLQAAIDNTWSRTDLREAIQRGGHTRRALPQQSPGHDEAVAAVDAAAAAAGTVRQPKAPVLPVAAVDPAAGGAGGGSTASYELLDAVNDLLGACLPLAAVPHGMQDAYKAVPLSSLTVVEVVLGQTNGVVGPARNADSFDALIPRDEFECTAPDRCAWVGATEEALVEHLRADHGM